MTNLVMPNLVNVEELDYLERNIAGALTQVSSDRRAPIIELLQPDDFTNPALRVLIATLIYADEKGHRVDLVSLPNIALEAGFIQAVDRGRLGALVVDLGLPTSTVGPVALMYVYAFIEAASRRKAKEHVDRLIQASNVVPSHEWEIALTETGKALHGLATRLRKAATA